jgi:hypothetical protein
MKTVLPGQPESRLQALATGCWGTRRITVRNTYPSYLPARFSVFLVLPPCSTADALFPLDRRT